MLFPSRTTASTPRLPRYIGEHVPGARVQVFADGGHIGIGHDAESSALIDGFLREIGYT
ncbi:hypothetical protein [Devosia nitrariae]|uniref:Uncharacterized protein n=1 Tax=Devosia nitrariae TaxID=2071872 RepID=A0ABQ5W5H6_9HYPH|nr:hypothetical protein [Devosia nitrariae]GLQ55114.1 hypothetical protein GCM10010862_23730 [Devosia nitrariae]